MFPLFLFPHFFSLGAPLPNDLYGEFFFVKDTLDSDGGVQVCVLFFIFFLNFFLSEDILDTDAGGMQSVVCERVKKRERERERERERVRAR